MPKVISYTPAWLSKPAPSYEIFTPSTTEAPIDQATLFNAHRESTKRKGKPGPTRTIARRGTEVFVAVGKEIKWGDLVFLKESWEAKQSRQRERSRREMHEEAKDDGEGHAQGYRVCLVGSILLIPR
jgi:nucleoporin NUP82